LVAAGRKETNNTFTGVAMGKVQDSDNINYGLFGYKGGEKTFSIDSNSGDAYFRGNGEFDGKITAKEGNIADWVIETRDGGHGGIYYGNIHIPTPDEDKKRDGICFDTYHGLIFR
jgi:hypothetical protein